MLATPLGQPEMPMRARVGDTVNCPATIEVIDR